MPSDVFQRLLKETISHQQKKKDVHIRRKVVDRRRQQEPPAMSFRLEKGASKSADEVTRHNTASSISRKKSVSYSPTPSAHSLPPQHKCSPSRHHYMANTISRLRSISVNHEEGPSSPCLNRASQTPVKPMRFSQLRKHEEVERSRIQLGTKRSRSRSVSVSISKAESSPRSHGRCCSCSPPPCQTSILQESFRQPKSRQTTPIASFSHLNPGSPSQTASGRLAFQLPSSFALGSPVPRSERLSSLSHDRHNTPSPLPIAPNATSPHPFSLPIERKEEVKELVSGNFGTSLVTTGLSLDATTNLLTYQKNETAESPFLPAPPTTPATCERNAAEKPLCLSHSETATGHFSPLGGRLLELDEGSLSSSPPPYSLPPAPPPSLCDSQESYRSELSSVKTLIPSRPFISPVIDEGTESSVFTKEVKFTGTQGCSLQHVLPLPRSPRHSFTLGDPLVILKESNSSSAKECNSSTKVEDHAVVNGSVVEMKESTFDAMLQSNYCMVHEQACGSELATLPEEKSFCLDEENSCVVVPWEEEKCNEEVLKENHGFEVATTEGGELGAREENKMEKVVETTAYTAHANNLVSEPLPYNRVHCEGDANEEDWRSDSSPSLAENEEHHSSLPYTPLVLGSTTVSRSAGAPDPSSSRASEHPLSMRYSTNSVGAKEGLSLHSSTRISSSPSVNEDNVKQCLTACTPLVLGSTTVSRSGGAPDPSSSRISSRTSPRNSTMTFFGHTAEEESEERFKSTVTENNSKDANIGQDEVGNEAESSEKALPSLASALPFDTTGGMASSALSAEHSSSVAISTGAPLFTTQKESEEHLPRGSCVVEPYLPESFYQVQEDIIAISEEINLRLSTGRSSACVAVLQELEERHGLKPKELPTSDTVAEEKGEGGVSSTDDTSAEATSMQNAFKATKTISFLDADEGNSKSHQQALLPSPQKVMQNFPPVGEEEASPLRESTHLLIRCCHTSPQDGCCARVLPNSVLSQPHCGQPPPLTDESSLLFIPLVSPKSHHKSNSSTTNSHRVAEDKERVELEVAKRVADASCQTSFLVCTAKPSCSAVGESDGDVKIDLQEGESCLGAEPPTEGRSTPYPHRHQASLARGFSKPMDAPEDDSSAVVLLDDHVDILTISPSRSLILCASLERVAGDATSGTVKGREDDWSALGMESSLMIKPRCAIQIDTEDCKLINLDLPNPEQSLCGSSEGNQQGPPVEELPCSFVFSNEEKRESTKIVKDDTEASALILDGPDSTLQSIDPQRNDTSNSKSRKSLEYSPLCRLDVQTINRENKKMGEEVFSPDMLTKDIEGTISKAFKTKRAKKKRRIIKMRSRVQGRLPVVKQKKL